jgi:hypothetical protein
MITEEILTCMNVAVRLVFLDCIKDDEDDMKDYTCDLATEFAEPKKQMVGISLRIRSDSDGE